MRTKKTLRNLISSISVSLLTIIIGLIAQRVFINTLGIEYLGINGLFTSIVSMLALVELGIGSAIYFNLYKPIADNDTTKIKALVNFYKNGYRVIAVAVFLLGLCTLPFLGTIVGNVSINENIYVIYLLFLLDIVFSYLLTYKRAVLYVDQNNHIISMVHLGYLIILNTLQIGILIITGNFYLYLVIKILMRIVENIILTIITNRKYTYLKDRTSETLDRATKSNIYKNIRGLSYHKIGSYVVIGSDNIIISVFFGASTVGLYSNYYLVFGAVGMLMTQAFSAITSSVGNLLVAANNKSFKVYKKINFGNFWISTFASTSILVIMNSFITLWIGNKYLLPIGVLAALSVNLFLTLIRSSISIFKEAAGIFHQDRFVPVVESIANILFSLTFLHFFGLAGVFIGTACSTLILHLFSYPKYVYKPLFKESYTLYYLEFLKYLVLAIIIASITFGISRLITIDNKYLLFITNVLICLLVPNIILFAIYRKNKDFQYFINLGKKIIR